MSHRRIVQDPTGLIIRETGTSRTLAVLPHDPLFEDLEPSMKLAKQIKALPLLLDFVRHKAFHDDAEAKRLLEEMGR